MRAAIEGVLEHNRHDLVSLAAVMSHALWLARDGPEACREPREQLALGRLYERAGDAARAAGAYELAARASDREVRRQALARLADACDDGSIGHDEAGGRVAGRAGLSMPRSRRRRRSRDSAAEALAIHHEHRARDLETARRYAETLARAPRATAGTTRSVASADWIGSWSVEGLTAAR